MTTANPLKSNGSASNAIPLSIENMENEIQRLQSINNELVTALREVDEIVNDANHSAEGRLCAAANRLLNTRAESATPAKHPDTERLISAAQAAVRVTIAEEPL